MIFVKTSQNVIKFHLKICLVSQISVHSLWHVWLYWLLYRETITARSMENYYKSLYFFADIFSLILLLLTYLFMKHDMFLCKFYIYRCFLRPLHFNTTFSSLQKEWWQPRTHSLSPTDLTSCLLMPLPLHSQPHPQQQLHPLPHQWGYSSQPRANNYQDNSQWLLA